MAGETPRKRLSQARLYVLVSSDVAKRPALECAELAAEGGADVIQLREKDLSDRKFMKLAKMMRDLTWRTDTLFIVNDRVAIAKVVEADGVHLGQDDLPAKAAREILGADKLIGVSTHEIKQAEGAANDGADYIGVGPVFPTATKGYETGVGVKYIREVAESDIGIPFAAIGAITLANLDAVMAAGARMVAVCSAIIAAGDVAAAARRFKEKLREREA